MIVRIIAVYVKPEYIDEFEEETRLNREASMDEPGMRRFDVLRHPHEKGRYALYEVYRDEAATVEHKETPHYARWKEKVEPMMAAPREADAYEVVAPDDPEAW